MSEVGHSDPAEEIAFLERQLATAEARIKALTAELDETRGRYKSFQEERAGLRSNDLAKTMRALAELRAQGIGPAEYSLTPPFRRTAAATGYQPTEPVEAFTTSRR